MFDLGWSELLLIAIVALIVVGPKDLPVLFRRVGEFVGKAKRMAREFSRAMDEAAREAGVDDIQKGLKSATNPLDTALGGVRDAASSLTGFDPDSNVGMLSAERAEAKKKMDAKAARIVAERKAREAEEARQAAEAAEAALKAETTAGDDGAAQSPGEAGGQTPDAAGGQTTG